RIAAFIIIRPFHSSFKFALQNTAAPREVLGIVAGKRADHNLSAAGRSMDKLVIAQINAHMVAQVAVRNGVKEHQIPAFELAHGQLGALAIALCISGSAQADAGLAESVGGEAGAVKAAHARGAPDIGFAQLGPGRRNNLLYLRRTMAVTTAAFLLLVFFLL